MGYLFISFSHYLFLSISVSFFSLHYRVLVLIRGTIRFLVQLKNSKCMDTL